MFVFWWLLSAVMMGFDSTIHPFFLIPLWCFAPLSFLSLSVLVSVRDDGRLVSVGKALGTGMWSSWAAGDVWGLHHEGGGGGGRDVWWMVDGNWEKTKKWWTDANLLCLSLMARGFAGKWGQQQWHTWQGGGVHHCQSNIRFGVGPVLVGRCRLGEKGKSKCSLSIILCGMRLGSDWSDLCVS